MRPDLPQLLQALRDAGCSKLGMRTDGLALNKANRIQHLKQAGLNNLIVSIPTIRHDAGDWLCGIPGATARKLRLIPLWIEQGLDLCVEIVLTRPTVALNSNKWNWSAVLNTLAIGAV